MTTAILASVLAAFVLSLIAIFQVLLAIGLPFGRAAWGGTHRVLPPRLRIASVFSSLLLGLAAWIVLARTDVVRIPWQPSAVRAGTWFVFSFLTLNTVGNFASKSRIERTLMTPVPFVCAACLLVVALSSSP
jgi:hypothetical protein